MRGRSTSARATRSSCPRGQGQGLGARDMKRISLFVVVGLALMAHPMAAQERLGSGAPDQQYRAGWTFTPTIGVAETYDTNVSLFSQGHTGNDDYISSVFPGADLHYS